MTSDGDARVPRDSWTCSSPGRRGGRRSRSRRRPRRSCLPRPGRRGTPPGCRASSGPRGGSWPSCCLAVASQKAHDGSQPQGDDVVLWMSLSPARKWQRKLSLACRQEDDTASESVDDAFGRSVRDELLTPLFHEKHAGFFFQGSKDNEELLHCPRKTMLRSVVADHQSVGS